jgi:predicted GNAT family N-acyltransferase
MVRPDDTQTGIGLVPHPESTDYEIELLCAHHDRAAFRCGNERLDRYLQSSATQDRKRNIAIPYVIYDRSRQKIIGYYTLSMSGINLEELPPNLVKKLPRYPIVGVNLIGRLAVANDYRGSGWGKLLIMDALHRSWCISKATASFAVVVEAIDDEAVKFYQRFDFQAFPDRPFKLFRMMTDIDLAFVKMSM